MKSVFQASAMLLLVAAPALADGGAGEWSGFVGLELRAFSADGAFPGQDDDVTGSLVIEPEYFYEWNGGRDRVVAKPFLRLDSSDDERTHFDVRELYWQRVGDAYELDVGLRTVFWGVTESLHLVDIVNQTDLVEDLDGEDKLGQPMVRLGLERDWGYLELFLLPGFRERTFPGVDGRFRPPIPVDVDDARYASSAEDGHVDAALRFSRVLGDVDLGVTYFRGTSREPLLVPAAGGSGGARPVPFYPQLDQVGLDLQATLDAWLLKVEAVARWSDPVDDPDPGFGDYLAAVGGFEYTFFDVGGRGLDVGVLAEYQWDERGDLATVPTEDDLFVAARLALNDVQSTELLVGGAVDLGSGATFFNLEGSRRLGDRYELEVRLRAFAGAESSDPLAALLEDDYLQVAIRRYF
ncbi:MAG: hypothetical protein AAGM22_24570 [Acidobacteriota bacterium]